MRKPHKRAKRLYICRIIYNICTQNQHNRYAALFCIDRRGLLRIVPGGLQEGLQDDAGYPAKCGAMQGKMQDFLQDGRGR